MSRAFYLQTYGCQMNEQESGVVRSILAEAGFAETSDETAADVLLMMTCSVRGHAEARALGRLGTFRALRAQRPGAVVGVLGCMAQNLQAELVSDAGADVVAGPDEYRRLPELIESARTGLGPQVAVALSDECYDTVTARPASAVTTYLTVMRGCDSYCSYCIVPFVKGRERSRPLASIVAEARRLTDQGIKEVALLGQNVLAYDHGGRRFGDVLRAVHAIPGVERIRFLTSHPRDLDQDLLETVAELPRVCPAFHLPLQSGSDRILELMNRGYTRDAYLRKIDMIRSLFPEPGLTTDVLVGFPSETDDDFEQTLDVVYRVRFDQAFMFRFSLRPGTRAGGIRPVVSGADAGRRLSRLIEVQNRITLERNRELVGRELELLVEGPAPRGNGMLGRTVGNHVVVVSGVAEVGTTVRARVTGLAGWTPHALPVESASPVRELAT
jgi:tRNA-2-methylthio-N6-dimethylallyladenosine synthase